MKNDSPKISIIIPVYNTEKLLPLCIDSILSQSYSDFELLLVNDGSIDNSGNICDEYAEKDSRIRVFHQENKGVSRARNVGLSNAKGEWIFFCDSDDYLSSNDGLFNLHKYFDRNISLIQFSHSNVKNGIIQSSNNQKKENQILTKLDFIRYGSFKKELWKQLFKRSIIEKHNLRFLENISYAEDWEFVIKYVQYVDSVVVSPNIIYNHVYHHSSLMARIYDVKFLFQHLEVLERFLSFRQGEKVWDSFLQKQSSEILHFFLQIILKCNVTDIERSNLLKKYRYIYRSNYFSIGVHVKFILAYVSFKLYILIAREIN